MTMTTEMIEALNPEDLAGKTRAELLELCRVRGLKATAWKRDRMLAELTGLAQSVEDSAGAAPKANVLASQLEKRRSANESGDQARRKALENRAKRTGVCVAVICKDRCETWAPAGQDAFHWELCVCGHSQWAHAKAAGEPTSGLLT